MSNVAGKTALIIEDDFVSIKVLEQLLKQVNMNIQIIVDHVSVPEQLEAISAPDVIFLDLEMPQSNGYSVLHHIQNNPKFNDVPVVAYTTHISHLNEARRAGFHSFLGKPVDGRQFPTYIEQILSGNPVWEVPS